MFVVEQGAEFCMNEYVNHSRGVGRWRRVRTPAGRPDDIDSWEGNGIPATESR
jgi:hypothetical protein